MRILHVYKTYYPDCLSGTASVISEICVGLRKHNIETRIFTFSENPTPALLKRPEADVYRAKQSFEIASCPFSLRGLFEFKKHAQWADIIHYHFPWPFADLMQLVNRVKKPTIITYHSDIVKQAQLYKLYAPLMKKFLQSARTIVATSQHYADSSDVLSACSRPIKVIPLGVNEDNYPALQPELAEQWKKKISGPFFLFVGVLRYYKGLSVLLEAAKNAPYTIVIVGDGPLKNELTQQANALELDNIYFAGAVSEADKMALLHACLGFVFPSHMRSEAFGVALIEAAMVSKPMISTNIGTGTDYINKHNTSGLVVPPNDSDALRHAMDTLFEDDALREKMGAAARQRYLDLFTGDKMVEAYRRLYCELLP